MNKFKETFLKKNQIINLISKKDEQFIEEKHIFDSLAIGNFFEKYGDRFNTLLDIGTGGGFPALPIAIKYPNLQVYAIDSIRKKINAINDIKNELGIKNITPICERVEKLKGQTFDIITSRAVAKLNILCKYGLPLLKKGGFLIVYKSKQAQEELAEARNTINKLGGKFIELIEYKLPLEEHFERNLVIIKKIK